MGVLAAAQYLNDERGHVSTHTDTHTHVRERDCICSVLNKLSVCFSISTFMHHRVTYRNGREHVTTIDISKEICLLFKRKKIRAKTISF